MIPFVKTVLSIRRFLPRCFPLFFTPAIKIFRYSKASLLKLKKFLPKRLEVAFPGQVLGLASSIQYIKGSGCSGGMIKIPFLLLVPVVQIIPHSTPFLQGP
jgi:hypothetical protein